jgi:hypothetical protein
MGPQPPAANLIPPYVTATARVQVQTNKFFSPEMSDPGMGKRSEPSAPNKRSKAEDEDDLPFLVGEKVRAKATDGASAALTAEGAPPTPLTKAPTARTAAGKVTIEVADDEGDVKSKSSYSFILCWGFTNYLLLQMRKRKERRRRRVVRKRRG